MFMSAMVRIFSFGERWNVPFNSAVASLNGTFHLSPHENILTIALINIHYLYTIQLVFFQHGESSQYKVGLLCTTVVSWLSSSKRCFCPHWRGITNFGGILHHGDRARKQKNLCFVTCVENCHAQTDTNAVFNPVPPRQSDVVYLQNSCMWLSV
jgi:hypothetical protein